MLLGYENLITYPCKGNLTVSKQLDGLLVCWFVGLLVFLVLIR